MWFSHQVLVIKNLTVGRNPATVGRHPRVVMFLVKEGAHFLRRYMQGSEARTCGQTDVPRNDVNGFGILADVVQKPQSQASISIWCYVHNG